MVVLQLLLPSFLMRCEVAGGLWFVLRFLLIVSGIAVIVVVIVI